MQRWAKSWALHNQNPTPARTSATTRAHSANHSQSWRPEPLPNPGYLHESEGPVASTPHLEVKAVRQEGTDAAGKEVEKTAQTPVSAAQFRTLPNERVIASSLLESSNEACL